MPKKLTEKQKKELTDVFHKFDKNGDGSITCEELISVMRCLGQNPTQAQASKMINDMDPNDNGKIEFQEFYDYMSKKGLNTVDEEKAELKAAFQVFDRDRNGFITADELRHTLTNLGERMTNDEVDDMIDEADVDDDNKINYEEFVKIMTSKQ